MRSLKIAASGRCRCAAGVIEGLATGNLDREEVILDAQQLYVLADDVGGLALDEVVVGVHAAPQAAFDNVRLTGQVHGNGPMTAQVAFQMISKSIKRAIEPFECMSLYQPSQNAEIVSTGL